MPMSVYIVAVTPAQKLHSASALHQIVCAIKLSPIKQPKRNHRHGETQCPLPCRLALGFAIIFRNCPKTGQRRVLLSDPEILAVRMGSETCVVYILFGYAISDPNRPFWGT